MVDNYTKAILTVIAGCLIILIARDLPVARQAFAQSGPVHVVIDGAESFALQFAGPIQVRAN